MSSTSLKGAAAGLVVGLATVLAALAATFAIAIGQDRSFGAALLARAVVAPDEVSLQSGPGVLLVPLLAAAVGALVATRFHRRSGHATP